MDRESHQQVLRRAGLSYEGSFNFSAAGAVESRVAHRIRVLDVIPQSDRSGAPCRRLRRVTFEINCSTAIPTGSSSRTCPSTYELADVFLTGNADLPRTAAPDSSEISAGCSRHSTTPRPTGIAATGAASAVPAGLDRGVLRFSRPGRATPGRGRARGNVTRVSRVLAGVLVAFCAVGACSTASGDDDDDRTGVSTRRCCAGPSPPRVCARTRTATARGLRGRQ